MNVILTEDHDTLGMRGDLVSVKNGYGRNFLIPRQLAVLATKGAIKKYEEETRQAAHKIEARKEQAETQAASLKGTEVIIPMRVGEEDRIFGSVTTQQIADELKAQGTVIDRKKITLDEDVKSVGVYPATVRLHPEVSTEIQVRVIAMMNEEA